MQVKAVYLELFRVRTLQNFENSKTLYKYTKHSKKKEQHRKDMKLFKRMLQYEV